MFEKFGFKREEFFITSKQGFLNLDSIEGIPPQLVIEELSVNYPSLKQEVTANVYCASPTYLDFCLKLSLKRLNIDTLDCLFI